MRTAPRRRVRQLIALAAWTTGAAWFGPVALAQVDWEAIESGGAPAPAEENCPVPPPAVKPSVKPPAAKGKPHGEVTIDDEGPLPEIAVPAPKVRKVAPPPSVEPVKAAPKPAVETKRETNAGPRSAPRPAVAAVEKPPVTAPRMALPPPDPYTGRVPLAAYRPPRPELANEFPEERIDMAALLRRDLSGNAPKVPESLPPIPEPELDEVEIDPTADAVVQPPEAPARAAAPPAAPPQVAAVEAFELESAPEPVANDSAAPAPENVQAPSRNDRATGSSVNIPPALPEMDEIEEVEVEANAENIAPPQQQAATTARTLTLDADSEQLEEIVLDSDGAPALPVAPTADHVPVARPKRGKIAKPTPARKTVRINSPAPPPPPPALELEPDDGLEEVEVVQ